MKIIATTTAMGAGSITTSMALGAGSTAASIESCRTDNPADNAQRKGQYIGTTAATATSLITSASLNCNAYSEHYREKLRADYYRQAYVDSLTDQQLAEALQQLEGNNSETINEEQNSNEFSK